MDLIVLVVPIDSAAPKGRLILPQQQTIRDILESGAVSIVVRETELADTLKKLGRDPDLVITDSQAFKQVSAIVPEHVPLTSFSILFARYKGNLKTVVHGAYTLDKLKKGDKILISEGCTHHRQCGDIGTVKLPNLIRRYTGKEISSKMCRRCTHSYDKLWNCNCLYERNLEPEHLYLSGHVRLKGNLNLVTDYIVCSSFTRKAPLGAFLQGIVTVNAIYIS